MNKPLIHKVANGDTLRVNAGINHLYLSYPTDEDTYIFQHIQSDSLHTVQHEFDLSKNEIILKNKNASIRFLIGGDIVALSDSGSQIKLDQSQFTEEFGVFKLSESIQKLTFENPKFYPKDFLVSKKENVQYQQFFFYPDEKLLTTFELIPGIAQLKREEYVKSAIVFGAFIGSASLIYKFHSDYSTERTDYYVIRENYLNATNPRTALLAGDQMEEAFKGLKPYRVRRNLSILGIIGVLAYDIVDIFRAQKELEKRTSKDFEFFLEPFFDDYISAGAKFKF
ncbi:MAG: DUF5683 domain-containing protein [Balneolaceae bacterium]